MGETQDACITIEVLKGGFVLHYPKVGEAKPNQFGFAAQEREIFTSPRKLNQKLKEVIDSLSLVPADTGKTE